MSPELWNTSLTYRAGYLEGLAEALRLCQSRAQSRYHDSAGDCIETIQRELDEALHAKPVGSA
jgi:hypothetical protein